MKVSKLGNLEKPFLIIANLSAVNEASYSIEVIGLTREKKPKKTPKTEAAEKMKVETEVA